MIFKIPKPQLFEAFDYEVREQVVADFHNSNARLKICSAPARTSKSYAAAHDCLPDFFPSFDIQNGRAYPREDVLGWIVGPDYRTIKEWDYLVECLVDRRERLDFPMDIESYNNSPAQGNMRLVVNWKKGLDGRVRRSILEGKSETNERSLQGEAVTFCIQSEAAEHKPSTYPKYLAPRVDKLIWPTTPKIRADWIKQEIDTAESDMSGLFSIESFRFTPKCNPTYDWDRFWIEHAKAESRVLGKITTEPRAHDCFVDGAVCSAAKDPWFAEQFLGLWTYEQDRVLPFRWMRTAHSHLCHVIDEYPAWMPSARIFISCDYGYNDPACAIWWAVGHDGTLVMFDEIYESQLDPSSFVRKIHEKSKALSVHPDYYVGDPQKPEVARLMRERGLPVWDREKARIRDRAAGHLALVDALSADPATGRPLLYIHENCRMGIAEWKVLRRKGGASAQDEWAGANIAGDDHFFDAARYGIQTRPKAKAAEKSDWLREHQRVTKKIRRMEKQQSSRAVRELVGSNPRSVSRLTAGGLYAP